MRGKALRCLGGALLLGAALSPLAWPRGRDDFPLSPYPMFTARRDRIVTVNHVLGVDGSGDAQPLPPSIVANGAVMQAAATIRRAIAAGATRELCARVAARIAEMPSRDETEILVATSTFDMQTYFAGARAPLRREVHARCRVAEAAR